MAGCEGNRPDDDTRRMEALRALGLADPQSCVERCATAALSRVLPPDLAYCGAMTEDVCVALELLVDPKDLWSQYWCDATFCGVANNNQGRLGQDPMVNRIIGQCQNIGYNHVVDPGPPPPDYACSFYIDEPVEKRETCVAPSVASSANLEGALPTTTEMMQVQPFAALSEPVTVAPPPPPPPQPPPISTQQPSSKPNLWLPETIYPSPSPPARTTLAATASTARNSASSAVAPQQNSDKDAAPMLQSQPSIGTVVAIAICVPIAIMLVTFLAYFLWRRKRRSKNKTDSLQGHLVPAHTGLGRHSSGPRPSADGNSGRTQRTKATTTKSTTRTRTTAQSKARPLCAPPRLGDRKYLPNIFRRSESPPLTPLGPAPENLLGPTPRATPTYINGVPGLGGGGSGSSSSRYAFPSSPICMPTVSKLEPRNERTATTTTLSQARSSQSSRSSSIISISNNNNINNNNNNDHHHGRNGNHQHRSPFADCAEQRRASEGHCYQPATSSSLRNQYVQRDRLDQDARAFWEQTERLARGGQD